MTLIRKIKVGNKHFWTQHVKIVPKRLVTNFYLEMPSTCHFSGNLVWTIERPKPIFVEINGSTVHTATLYTIGKLLVCSLQFDHGPDLKTVGYKLSKALD